MRPRVDVGYDDNPFLLSKGAKNLLENAGPAEQTSGRFRDMKSASDYIITPSVDFEAEGPGLAGRRLSLKAEVGYQAYVRNRKRSYVGIDLSAEQNTSKRGRTRFRFEFVPDYFQRNYLADAVDADLNGSISPSERVYRPGNYKEWDLTLDYRHRLFDEGPRSFAVWFGAGYLRRRYDAPFVGRDRDAPHAGVGFDAELAKRWQIEFKYGLAGVDSPRRAEVLLLDEPSFSVDFNGDGDTSDIEVRTVQSVDRTHTEQQYEIESRFGLSKGAHLRVGYERRHRHFSSHEPFDVGHNRRTDDRDTIDFALVARLAHHLHLVAGYAYVRQDTNRSGDPASLGEITDYRRNGAYAGLTFKF